MKLRSIVIGLLLALATPLAALAQCSGQAPSVTYCGNPTGALALPGWKPLSGITRERLAANRTYYVRATGGSNANCSGLANVSDPGTGALPRACAFATPQKASDTILYTLDLNTFSATAELTGAFTSGFSCGATPVGGGTITVNSTAGASIATADANAVQAYFGCRLSVTGNITLSTATAGGATPACFSAYGYGKIEFSGVTFAASVGPHLQAGWQLNQFFAPNVTGPGFITAKGNYTITGGNLSHMHVTSAGSEITVDEFVTVTLTGTPNFSGYFLGINNGMFYGKGTYVGAATGMKFLLHHGGVAVPPVGADETYLPGSVAGVVQAVGSYTPEDDLRSRFGVASIYGGSTVDQTLNLFSTSGAGTTDAIVLYTGAQAERMRITNGGNVNIGPNVAPDAKLTINSNTGASIAPGFDGIHLVASDAGVGGTIAINQYANAAPILVGVVSGGTQAAKTAVAAGTTFLNLTSRGWDGSAETGGVSIALRTFNLWTSTNHSTDIIFNTTSATPSAIRSEAGKFHPSGGLSVGVAAADPGTGNINLGGGSLLNNGTVPTGTGAYVRGSSPSLTTPVINGTITGTTVIPVLNGGTGVATAAAEQARLAMGMLMATSISVNFANANTDNAVTIALPAGMTRWSLQNIRITAATASLSGATVGFYTATVAGGTAIITAATAMTVTATADATANNFQSIPPSTVATYTTTTPQFRTAATAAGTATVTVFYYPSP